MDDNRAAKLRRSLLAHQAMARALAGRQQQDVLDPDRPAHVQHDTAGAGREDAGSQGLDQAPAVRQGLGRHLPVELRQVDHHPGRVRQGENPVAGLLRKLQNEAGFVGMDPDSHGLGDRIGEGRRHRQA